MSLDTTGTGGTEEGDSSENDDIPLYRSMKIDEDGLPAIGPTNLGFRPGLDVVTDPDGLVHPGEGGVSVTPHDPSDLPQHRQPRSWGGTGRHPVWRTLASTLPGSLTYRPDPTKSTHGFLEPNKAMPVIEYGEAIKSTRELWERFDG